jgi:demethylmenaquinone methyltransferase/2-methoxy-6-polyprenyl-1,4-benzoquinol methylase
MFGRVAPRYDLANHILSFNVDRLWRAATVREFQAILTRPDAKVLDLCCGTGDLTRALQQAGPARVYGADFCHPMLVRARGKLLAHLSEADALQLPFPNACFDLVTVAFGFRNLADYDGGLREILRLLRPGGRIGILEFNEASGPFAPLYRFYSTQVLPRIGGVISGDASAYAYLPASIIRFPRAGELVLRMEDAGFREVAYRRFLFGAVCLHVGMA